MRRAVAIIGGVIGAGVLGVGALGTVFARRVVTPATNIHAPVKVLSVNRRTAPHTLTLSRGEDAHLPGRYSFFFDEEMGLLRVGDIVRQDSTSIERIIDCIDYGQIRRGISGRISSAWFADPQELGHPVEHVFVPSDVGDLPAWRIAREEASERVWAIHVHGRSAKREETLRGVIPLATLGITNLVMSYRNDVGAPSAPDGKYGLGVSESRDVESAIEYAVQHGAEAIVLVGWSMGGTAVLLAAEQSGYRAQLRGLILDSPAIDWNQILVHQAKRSRLPGTVAKLGSWMMSKLPRVVGLASSIDPRSLTAERFAANLRVPTLLHVSNADTFVPGRPAIQFAQLRPDLVSLNEVSSGEHVKLWNVDPTSWESSIEAFVTELLADVLSDGPAPATS